MLAYEGDISNYLGFDMKKKPDWTFKLSQSHLMEKITNHVELTVYASLKARETPSGKPILYKDKYSI